MAKATLILPNGTSVTIEGTTEEVHRLLLELNAQGPQEKTKPSQGRKGKSRRSRSGAKSRIVEKEDGPDLTEIVNLVKSVDEAEAIERQVLDRTGMVNRTLLPLYIVYEYLDNAFGLTSGDVKKITADLGVPMSQPNASTTLSKTAARYVMGDAVRKKGKAVKYKLSRRGAQYMKNVIAGKADEG